jgi:hypothetical protein
LAFVDEGFDVRDEGFAAGEDGAADVFAAVGGVVLVLRCHGQLGSSWLIAVSYHDFDALLV